MEVEVIWAGLMVTDRGTISVMGLMVTVVTDGGTISVKWAYGNRGDGRRHHQCEGGRW